MIVPLRWFWFCLKFNSHVVKCFDCTIFFVHFFFLFFSRLSCIKFVEYVLFQSDWEIVCASHPTAAFLSAVLK